MYRLLLLILFVLPHPAFAESANKDEVLRIESRKVEKGSAVIVNNIGPGDAVVSIEAVLKDAVASKPTPLTLTVKGNESVEAVRISPQYPNKAWSYNFKFDFKLGKLNAKHDPETLYVLPYPVGKNFAVIQSYNGTFSHQGELQYSIDWGMPEGSTVCAARAGKVVQIKIDSNEGGDDRPKFFDKGNFIAIEHADGTVGNYFHLKQNGASVKLGQEVKAGDAIGLSGATGFASSPHLHFHVQVPLDGKSYKTVPVKFITEVGVVAELEKDQAYAAVALPEAAPKKP